MILTHTITQLFLSISPLTYHYSILIIAYPLNPLPHPSYHTHQSYPFFQVYVYRMRYNSPWQGFPLPGYLSGIQRNTSPTHAPSRYPTYSPSISPSLYASKILDTPQPVIRHGVVTDNGNGNYR